MSDHGTHVAADGGHDDNEHGHAVDTLGPIDWTMWGVGVMGVISALIVVAGFVAATGFVFLTPGG